MMINETRILNEFIELVSVPCPSTVSYTHLDVYKRQAAHRVTNGTAVMVR